MKNEARAGGWPALALDRASGDLWLATNEGVQRLSPAGVLRWHTTWQTAATPDARETLVLDAHGTAYTCSTDGLLRAVSPAGHVLWQYQFRVPRYGFGNTPPSAALGPDGTLNVSSDGEPGIVAIAP
jgi:streptogramin lyase